MKDFHVRNLYELKKWSRQGKLKFTIVNHFHVLSNSM